MADEGRSHSCCQWATPEERAEDPEAFDCEACPVRAWQSRLSTADREAIRIYQLLRRPGVQELGLQPVAWEALGWVGTRDEALGLVERLATLMEHDLARAREQAATERDDG